MTGAQQQAVDSAEDYLSEGQGFTKQGLLNCKPARKFKIDDDDLDSPILRMLVGAVIK
jgi:hypothetical protein